MNNNTNNKITIFTDGSSRGNPGPGGWGAVIILDENECGSIQKVKVNELGGRETLTTNNRMELTAAIRALQEISKNALQNTSRAITVNTDSSYVINGITKWIFGWKQKGWRTMDKKEVVNRDLWEELDHVSSGLRDSGAYVSWNYVSGHIGITGNERCDEIATSFADSVSSNESTRTRTTKPLTFPKLFSGAFADYFLPNILEISATADDVSAKKSAKFVKSAKSAKSRSKAVAYSYISFVNGAIAIDKTWKACEARVKGKRGAKYKKALNVEEEKQIIAEFRK